MTAVPGVEVDPGPSGEGDIRPRPARRWAERMVVLATRRPGVGGIALLAVPFVVAVLVLRDPHWYADQDYALNELRVRDVLAGDPPLVGMSGRIVYDGVRGSHPGPLGFWLMAPVYWLFGRSSWALQVAAATLSLAGVTTTLWLAARRAGRWGVLAATMGLAVLVAAYGPERWAVPWNPFLAAMWWPVLLLAVWSVLCRDDRIVVVAVVAGSICAQAHVGYVGLVGALGAVALGALVVRAVVARHGGERRRLLWWIAAGCALGVLLWVPPLIDQVRNDPGNLAIIRGQFTAPSSPQVGLRRGLDIWLTRLDPWTLATGRELGGPAWPGVVLLGAWAVAAFAAWRRRLSELVRLHVVVAVALLAGLASISRIQGRVFGYLLLWSWGTVLVVLAAVVATAAAVATAPPGLGGRARATGRAALAVGAAVALIAATWGAARADQPGEQAVHEELLPDLVRALGADDVPGGGRGGRYLVRSDDPVMGGLNSYTVLLELERRGFDVGVDAPFSTDARPSRVLAPEDATAVLTYVVGPAIDDWRTRPDVVELARFAPPGSDGDGDTPAEVVRAEMRRAGMDELAAGWDGNVMSLALDTRIPDETLARIADRIGGSYPTSVFVGPVG